MTSSFQVIRIFLLEKKYKNSLPKSNKKVKYHNLITFTSTVHYNTYSHQVISIYHQQFSVFCTEMHRHTTPASPSTSGAAQTEI